MIANFYFWKWADNDLPGRPVDVFAALMRGELHPALQPFDARRLLRELETIAAADADPAQWEWRVLPADRPRKAHQVFLTCPRPIEHKDAELLLGLDVTCFDEDQGRIVKWFPPKSSEFVWGQSPEEPTYEITVDELPVLLKCIRPRSPDPIAILSNRQTSFVQCIAAGRRFCVEWRENYDLHDLKKFSHWRAQDQKKLRALNAPYTSDGIPQDKDPDLLTYSDTLRIFQAFLRGGPRPPQYHWMSINHWLKCGIEGPYPGEGPDTPR